MKKMTTTALLTTAVMCLSWLGCGREDRPAAGGKPASEKPRIALIMKARTNPFFHTMEVGAVRAAKKNDVDLLVMSVDRETDFAKQGGLVENAISQGVDAILIAPADSKAIVSALLDAQNKGIKIVNLDNRIDAEAAKTAGLKIEAFIGPDNADGAYKATQYLLSLMGGKGKVAMLEGIRGVDNAEQRKAGFAKAVAETQGKVQCVASESADWMTEPAQRKMEGILARFPDLSGVFCANDSMALGAIQAILTAGKGGKIAIVSYDNLKAAQDAIKAGNLHGTIEQHPDVMGEKGVEVAIKIVRGETVPKEIPIGTDLVTAETLK
ncbi:MAG: substrate-binding domain-containing protein [Phycisphaerae bacterium]|nr:substrate-binding domain-containing protein [Phycisphaerae bacterium]